MRLHVVAFEPLGHSGSFNPKRKKKKLRVFSTTVLVKNTERANKLRL